MSTLDYENWQFPFGKYQGKTIAEIPSSYLDWLIGEIWFVSKPRNKNWIEAIGKELAVRKRSGGEPEENNERETY